MSKPRETFGKLSTGATKGKDSKVVVFVGRVLKERLRHEAASRGLSVASLVRDVLSAHVYSALAIPPDPEVG